MNGQEDQVTLRSATPDDLPRIHDIYAHHVLTGGGSFEEAPPSIEDMLGRMNAVLAAGYPYIVAEVEGRVVGYAYGSSYRPRPAYRYSVENSIYVDEMCHRKGVGRRLLEDLITRCEAAGFRQMVAVIGDSGNHASIELHRSLGFRDVGIIRAVGFKFGRWLDSVIMQRPLSEADQTLPGD